MTDDKFRRTNIPCIYERRSSYYVRWYAKGKRRWKRFATMDEAIGFKKRVVKGGDDVVRDVLDAHQRRARAAADLTDAYGYIRQALQAVDRARASSTVERPLLAALYEAEEIVSEAIRQRGMAA